MNNYNTNEYLYYTRIPYAYTGINNIVIHIQYTYNTYTDPRTKNTYANRKIEEYL